MPLSRALQERAAQVEGPGEKDAATPIRNAAEITYATLFRLRSLRAAYDAWAKVRRELEMRTPKPKS